LNVTALGSSQKRWKNNISGFFPSRNTRKKKDGFEC